MFTARFLTGVFLRSRKTTGEGEECCIFLRLGRFLTGFMSLLQCRIGFLVGLVISVSREEIRFRYFVAKMPIANLVPSSDSGGATVDLDACGQGCGEHTDSVLGG